ncbi:MAG TPA: hypothetical protein VIL16_16400, partial [Trebonia sp.]
MRLSWYANTGIAVFSIWQGGTCTGTFRLPLDELSRLVDSLGRGLSDGPLPETGATGPIALGGQRARLAIGAAPMEAFTGAMNVLSDEQAAAYGVARPPQPAAAQPGDGYAASWPGANGYGQDVNGFGPAAANGYAEDVNGFGPAAANGYPQDVNGFGPPAANGYAEDANGFGPGVGGYQSDNADYVTEPSSYDQIPPFGGSQTGGVPVYPGQQDTAGQYGTGPQQAQPVPGRQYADAQQYASQQYGPGQQAAPGHQLGGQPVGGQYGDGQGRGPAGPQYEAGQQHGLGQQPEPGGNGIRSQQAANTQYGAGHSKQAQPQASPPFGQAQYAAGQGDGTGEHYSVGQQSGNPQPGGPQYGGFQQPGDVHHEPGQYADAQQQTGSQGQLQYGAQQQTGSQGQLQY